MNNFGWDFLQSDNVTYVSSGLGLLVAYMSHKRIKDPLSFVLAVLDGILPMIEEQYKNDKDVLKMLKGFDKTIKEYESSLEGVNDDVESEEEENKENDKALVRCTGVCSCSDDDDGCC